MRRKRLPAAARAFTVDQVAGIALGLNALVTAVLHLF